MELNKMEVAVVEEVVSKVAGGDLRELNDLQLAFVGGGIGDTAVWMTTERAAHMDYIKTEVTNEKIDVEVTDSLRDLNDLQLALVGGGIGDTAI